jgi:hypothetical protein
LNTLKQIFTLLLFSIAYFTNAQNVKVLESITIEVSGLSKQQLNNKDSIIQLDSTLIIKKKELTKDDTLVARRPKKKWIAALLAFPLPFGVVGLHRIYLGTKPHIPLVYVATIGGVFGLLPLADFIAILNSSPEELQSYQTGKVFLWLNK